MVENNKGDIDLTKDFIRDYELFSKEIRKVIVGQDEIIKQLLISIFCNGHCIIEGVPEFLLYLKKSNFFEQKILPKK